MGIRRTEAETAADVIVELVRSGSIGRDERSIGDACRALGLTSADIEASTARARARRSPTFVPLSRVPIIAEPGRTAPQTGPRKAQPSSYVALTGHVGRLDGEPASKRCTGCERVLPIDEFARTQAGTPRQDGTQRYRRRSRCRECQRAAQRDRYLTVHRRDGLRAVGFEFASDDDGLVCACCGEPVEPGERGLGVAVVIHERCRDRFTRDDVLVDMLDVTAALPPPDGVA